MWGIHHLKGYVGHHWIRYTGFQLNQLSIIPEIMQKGHVSIIGYR